MVTLSETTWKIHSLERIKTLIEQSSTIAISGHSNPDGDCIGALLSLGLGLERLNKTVFMVCPDPIPRNYRNLPGISRCVKNVNFPVDLAIAVDCGSKEMLGKTASIFEHAQATIEIDHHQSRTSFSDYSFVDSFASSAGELVYLLLNKLGITITKDIAQNILTSIIVETNSFRLPGINPRTFEICGSIIRTGVDFFRLAETVYWITSRQTALLSGVCLNRVRFSTDGKLAWSYLTQNDLDKVNASESDTDPICEKLRAIDGVRIAVLFREKDKDFWRVSFRSKGGVNVAQIAEKFGGGGHISAAGCTIPKKGSHKLELLTYTQALIDTEQVNNDYDDPIFSHPEMVFPHRQNQIPLELLTINKPKLVTTSKNDTASDTTENPSWQVIDKNTSKEKAKVVPAFVSF